VSILQGLVITAGTLFIYQYSLHQGFGEALTRTLVFTVLISANIFLTLINRSFHYSILTTLRYRNSMVPMIILITIGIVCLMLFLPPVTSFFEFQRPQSLQLLMAVTVGFVSVSWFELAKVFKRNPSHR
jgi:Ca2+-transporting ATPase